LEVGREFGNGVVGQLGSDRSRRCYGVRGSRRVAALTADAATNQWRWKWLRFPAGKVEAVE